MARLIYCYYYNISSSVTAMGAFLFAIVFSQIFIVNNIARKILLVIFIILFLTSGLDVLLYYLDKKCIIDFKHDEIIGIVKNHRSLPKYGKGNEEFDINNIHFKLANNNDKDSGEFPVDIVYNGMKVKVYYNKTDNFIYRIDQLLN